MSESEEVVVHTPITITIDVEKLLQSELGWSEYNAGSYEDPEPDYYAGGNGRIVDLVAVKLADALKKDVADAVRAGVRERALEKVDGLIDEMMSQPIMLTSTYGEPKSPETTMREAMIKAMTDRLIQPVGHDGKRKTDNYGTKQAYLEWYAEKTANSVMDREMNAKLSDAVRQIKTAATDLVSKKIADALGKIL